MYELIFALWVAWTDGDVSSHHCHQFAYAAEAATLVENDELPALLEALEGADITEYKRDMFLTALQFVAANRITNSTAAHDIALAMCLGQRKEGPNDVWTNKSRWQGPF
ncbi:MAG: hypothetical protein L0Y67_09165 [Gammaproteobacteria bacterium]|nr:hypothetical protein [Gammaproteobacteria bacterium]MCI0591738.1 hypothetical protein [Gammaproteobacteria bacterium]